MSQFYIVHLSDLHITDKLTTTLSRLIDSISKNRELVNKPVFLVITGDIINRGNYNYQKTAISFFKKLKSKTSANNIKFCDIHIVPGNHDKYNNSSTKLFSIAQQTGIRFPRSAAEQESTKRHHIPLDKDVVDLQNSAFSNYVGLCNAIFDLFDIRYSGVLKTYNKSYGVDSNTVDNTLIAFIRMNSAISCYGTPNDQEKYHLSIGTTQLEFLKEQYYKLRDISRDKEQHLITFCLSHHPAEYFEPEDSSIFNRTILSEDGLNVDYLLTGHVHDAAISNLSNHIRSVISLETGIGWPDDADAIHKEHRYAVYYFDEEKSVFSSTMYKTNQANVFEPDTDYLITDEEKLNKKIFSPFKARDFAFIDIGTTKNSNEYLFVNASSMIDLKELYKTITNFSEMCINTLSSYKARYVDLILKDSKYKSSAVSALEDEINAIKNGNYQNNDLKKMYEEICSIGIHENKETIRNLLIAYLQHITGLFVNYFNEYFDKEDFESRAVFRAYSKENDECISVCRTPSQTRPREDAKENLLGIPRNYIYSGSLIEYAYDSKKSIVYSVNKDKHNFAAENWDDFIAVVPNIPENTLTLDNGKKVPILSFVYSVRIREERLKELSAEEILQMRINLTRKLLLLQFTNIEEIIQSLVQDFTKHFDAKIDIWFPLKDNKTVLK